MKQLRVLKSIALTRALPLVGSCALIVCLALLCFANAAAAQTGQIIHQFDRRNGIFPSGGLAADRAGALYGVTLLGGQDGPETFGTVYRLVPPSTPGGIWRDQVLYAFTGGADGKNPSGGVLLRVRDGKIFGTAETSSGSGAIVYQLSQGSPWTETVIYTFPGLVAPNGGLIADAGGSLYGTTLDGGSCDSYYGCGTVYKLTPPTAPGAEWTQQVLYNFQGGNDGWAPSGGLVMDKTGALYGVTGQGGPGEAGVVYKLTPPFGDSQNWTESILHTFSGCCGNPEGAYPNGSLLFDSAGALYGTTSLYGIYDFGNVYQLVPPANDEGAWTENILYQFTGGADGGFSSAGLVFDSAGALYGTTSVGGDVGNRACIFSTWGPACGTVFKLIPPTPAGGSWTESVLHAFTSLGYPDSPVVLRGKHVYGATPRVYIGNNVSLPGTAFEITQ
jgi:uncharacterized repeat protein (TIGR03803 family)